MQPLVYVNVGLAVILTFVGLKMVFGDAVNVPVWLSLLVIVVVMAVTVAASLWREFRTQSTVTRTVPPAAGETAAMRPMSRIVNVDRARTRGRIVHEKG